MRRTCEKCGQSYEDVEFSTLCPHNHIDGNYCRKHDLFDCWICSDKHWDEVKQEIGK